MKVKPRQQGHSRESSTEDRERFAGTVQPDLGQLGLHFDLGTDGLERFQGRRTQGSCINTQIMKITQTTEIIPQIRLTLVRLPFKSPS